MCVCAFEKKYYFYITKIGLSFSKLIISLKIFNSANKLNPSISNRLLCFKDFSMFKHFSFTNTQSSDFNFFNTK